MRWESHTQMSGNLGTPHLDSANAAARSWPAGMALAAVLAAAVVIFDAPQPFRPLVILVFLGLVPGLCLIDLLGIGDLTQRLALGIGVSLALATIVSGLSLYAGLWSPLGILLVLVAITLVGAAAQLRLLARSPDDTALDSTVRVVDTDRAGDYVTSPGAAMAAPCDKAAKSTTAAVSNTPVLPAMAKSKDDSSATKESVDQFPSVRLTKIVVFISCVGGFIMLISRRTRRAPRT